MAQPIDTQENLKQHGYLQSLIRALAVLLIGSFLNVAKFLSDWWPSLDQTWLKPRADVFAGWYRPFCWLCHAAAYWL